MLLASRGCVEDELIPVAPPADELNPVGASPEVNLYPSIAEDKVPFIW